jgi:hypothetical protein
MSYFSLFQNTSDPNMAERRRHIFIDATLESQAPVFHQNGIFNTWLHSYDNVPDALRSIREITLPYSTQVYVARDNILDNVPPLNPNDPTRTLLDTLCDLQTVQNVSVFCPTINTDIEPQIRSILPDKRLLRDVVSVINLHGYMCREGIQYFKEEIGHCIVRNEIHLISNLIQNVDDLMEYSRRVREDQKRRLDALQEEYSNKPGEEPS